MKAKWFLVLFLVAVSVGGCGGGGTPTPTPTPTPVKVVVSCISHLQIGVVSNNYACTASEAVTWSVDKASLATITGAGILTPNTTSTGTVTVTATAASGSDTPGTATVNVVDWILYEGNGGVSVMNSDGSNSAMLFPASAGCSHQTWVIKPLEFICQNDLTPAPLEFFVYTTDGTAAGTKLQGTLQMDQIGELDQVQFAHASPDGKTIVFTGFKETVVGSATEDIEGVWTIGVDGSGLVELATEPYGDGVLIENPRFSPDGKEVLYNKGRNVWLTNSDGSNPHQLVSALSYMAIFSPEMTKLYYNTPAGSFMAAADGTNPVQISSGNLLIWGVSPNGASIVFWDQSTNSGGVVTANADGSDQKNIAVGAPSDW
jgi:hypothetical protein